MFSKINPADTRKENLRYLVERYGQANVAKWTGKPDRQVSDMLHGRKSFGEKVATAMEAAWKDARGEAINLSSPGMVAEMEGELTGYGVAEPRAHYEVRTEPRGHWPFSTPFSAYEALSDEKKRRLDERVADFLAGAEPPRKSSGKKAA